MLSLYGTVILYKKKIHLAKMLSVITKYEILYYTNMTKSGGGGGGGGGGGRCGINRMVDGFTTT